MAELLKRRVIAALAPRNSPSFDILATKGDKTVRIRVKTKSAKYHDWQWMAKKDGSIFRGLSRRSDFTVLVNLTPETKDMQFFIVPTFRLNALIKTDFADWAATPGRHNRKHDATTRKRNLAQAKYKDRFSTDWNVLWRMPARTTRRS